MEVYGQMIINWAFGTLITAIAAAIVVVGVMVIGIGGLKAFNGLVSYMTAEAIKTKGIIKKEMGGGELLQKEVGK